MHSSDCIHSRRRFLSTVAGAGGAMLLGPRWVNADGGGTAGDDVDPRAAQVIARTIGVDMHNHVYPAGTEPHPQGGPPLPQGPELLLAEELKRSGLTAVGASYVLDFVPNVRPGEAREKLFNWFDAIDTQLAKGRMRRALNLKDLEDAHEHQHPTIVQTVEGSQFIEGRLERVEEVYRRGLRDLQLLHEKDDLVKPLGDVNTAPAHLGGLTAFGAEVVKECNRLGILVDMAHAAHKTVLDVARVSGQPFIVSHTNLDTWTGKNLKLAAMMKPRLIGKEDAKVVADIGGVVGVWTHLTDSLTEFVESIKAMVDAVGVDHTGIGTDTDLLSSRSGQGTNVAYPNMHGKFFSAVVGEMLRQGFAAEEIRKVGGGNFCRVFGKVTALHS